MKRYITLTIALMICAIAIGQWPQGIVVEGEQMESKILEKAVKYTVYLPPGYRPDGRLYPVVYLLHGYTGSDQDWVQYGRIDQIMDKAIGKRELPPMIIVMPDGENNWYMNSYDGKIRYEDMFIEEFIPRIERKFNIRKGKEFTAIAGLSMGGFGSMNLAFRHPELFAASAGLSAGIVTDKQFTELPQEKYDEMFGDLYGEGLSGEERLTDHYKSYSLLCKPDPVEIHADSIKYFYLYIDCGDDDWLSVGNAQLHINLTEEKFPHEYRVRDGKHTWEYWRTGIVDALKFISKSFTR